MTTPEWLLVTVEKSGAAMRYRELCVTWAREVGTNGNVVTWPKPIISAALDELEHQGLIGIRPPKKQRA